MVGGVVSKAVALDAKPAARGRAMRWCMRTGLLACTYIYHRAHNLNYLASIENATAGLTRCPRIVARATFHRRDAVAFDPLAGAEGGEQKQEKEENHDAMFYIAK